MAANRLLRRASKRGGSPWAGVQCVKVLDQRWASTSFSRMGESARKLETRQRITRVVVVVGRFLGPAALSIGVSVPVLALGPASIIFPSAAAMARIVSNLLDRRNAHVNAAAVNRRNEASILGVESWRLFSPRHVEHPAQRTNGVVAGEAKRTLLWRRWHWTKTTAAAGWSPAPGFPQSFSFVNFRNNWRCDPRPAAASKARSCRWPFHGEPG